MTQPRPDAMQNPSTQPPYGFDVHTGSFSAPNLPPGADGQTFDEYRWSQLVEENKRIISVLAAIKERLDVLEEVTGAIRKAWDSTVARIEALETKDQPAAKPVDETNAKIVEFLESTPDVKFTAITIRENLGIPAKYIHDRCKTLVRQGLIRTHVEPGRHPFYQALEKKAEPADGQPA